MSVSYAANRQAALLGSCLVVVQTLTGCGSARTNTSNLPPIDDSAKYAANQAQAAAPAAKPGMSNNQKVAILVGAAALYYLYQKNQQAHKQGNKSEPQYYLSKNGRVYYRDAGGRAHWVTPPAGGISVPREEAQQYSGFQGYDGSTSGRDLTSIGTAQ
jgi:hypothetical protein